LVDPFIKPVNPSIEGFQVFKAEYQRINNADPGQERPGIVAPFIEQLESLL
jgi:hypothetical protein